MKILIAGSGGLLGANFLLAARHENHEVIAVYHRHPIHAKDFLSVAADLSNRDETISIVREHRPDWVINCVALTDVDRCQQFPMESDLINVKLPANLAEACAEIGAGLVYISTDAVFDGARGNYSEIDIPNPINQYAKSKLLGEKAVREILEKCLILRTNIFGWNTQKKINLAEWILSLLGAGKPIKGFTDTIFNPLLVNDLSEIILKLAARNTTGLLHLGTSDSCNKYEFALKIAATFDLDASLIGTAMMHEVNFRTPRPLQTTLQVAKAEAVLGRKMPGIDDSISHFRRLRQGSFYESLKELSMGA